MKIAPKEWLLLTIGIFFGILILFILQKLSEIHKIYPPIVSNTAPQSPGKTKKVPTVNFNPSAPTLETIFSDTHNWVATLSANRVRTLIVTGDVSLARQVNIQILQKNNPKWPFEKTQNLLSNSDITFINLENPLLKNCPIVNSGFVFCGDAGNVEGLLFAGVDVVNFANNHASNYGVDGVNETVQLLEKNSIAVSGVHGPVYKTIEGITFAFLGYNEVNIQPGVNQAEESLVKKEIALARANADIIVVQFHWGVEYTHQPSAHQKILGHVAIDAGADVVIGNHPHWYQAVELYKNKLIAYSHGNFIFDQMWSQETREGVVGKYTFYDSKLIDVEYIPIFIYDYGQPAIIDDQINKQKIVNIMKMESLKLSSL